MQCLTAVTFFSTPALHGWLKRLVGALLLGQVVCLTIFLSFTTSGNYFWFSTTKVSPRQANCSSLEQKLWYLWMLFIRPGGCSVLQFFFSLTTSGNFLIFNHQGICKTSKLPLSWNKILRHLWMLFYWARLVVCLTIFLQFNHFWKLFDFQTPRDLQHE